MSLRDLLSGKPTPVAFSLKAGPMERLRDTFMTVGAPVHNLRPEQNLHLLRMAIESLDAKYCKLDDYEILYVATKIFEKRFKEEMGTIASKNGMHTQRALKNGLIQFREKDKDAKRMREKETDPSEGATSAASHTDGLAVTFYGKTIQQVTRLHNFLRPCNHTHSVSMKEKVVSPDDTNWPGTTVKYVMYADIGTVKNVPLVTEIIILKDGCQKYSKSSHKGVDTERHAKKWMQSDHEDVDYTLLSRVGTIGQKAAETRALQNKEMTDTTGLFQLMETRKFYVLDDELPICHTVKQHGGEQSCFIPDVETGFFRTENALLDKLKDAQPSTRLEFLARARAMVPAPDMRKASKPQLELLIA